jgi:hypothetical protein
MLQQPSLSGGARISVLCTLNSDSDVSAVAKSMSILNTKKEDVDANALLER